MLADSRVETADEAGASTPPALPASALAVALPAAVFKPYSSRNKSAVTSSLSLIFTVEPTVISLETADKILHQTYEPNTLIMIMIYDTARRQLIDNHKLQTHRRRMVE